VANVIVKPFESGQTHCIHIHAGDIVVCHKCGKPASIQCDFIKNNLRCDATLCKECRVNVSPSKDYCPDHNDQKT
jgi:hypothetical protein